MPPTPPNRPMNRPGGPGPAGRPMGAAGAGGARPGMSGGPRPGGAAGMGGAGARPGGMGAPGGNVGLGNRRDVTEKKEKIIYFSQLNFDQTANDYLMTKTTIGTFVVLVILAVLAYFFGWGINAWLGIGLAFLFWGFYFFSSIVVKPKMAAMEYKDKKNYWTYELTDEYKQRNVVLNDFKQKIATELIKPNDKVLIDEVSVELASYNPLIFDFAIRSSITDKEVKQKVPNWAGKFSCETGTVTNTDINTWRVVYPREGMWKTLEGRKVSPNDVLGTHHEPTISYNPIGVRTDTRQEMYITNADCHTVITGDSGFGKSNTFNLILKNQFANEALLLFFDFKQSEAPAVNDRCFSVIRYEQMLAWKPAIMAEISRRNSILTKQGAKKFLPASEASSDPDALPFTADFPPIIIAIDECGMWCESGTREEKTAFKDFINEVSRVGRSAGVTLICGSQSPRDSDIPDLVKRNSTQFIAYHQTSETVKAAIGKERTPSEADPSSIPNKKPNGGGGVGQFALVAGSTNDMAVPVKAYFVTAQDIISEAKNNKNKKKTNLKVVQHAMREYDEIKSKSKLPQEQLCVSLLDPTIPANVIE